MYVSNLKTITTKINPKIITENFKKAVMNAINYEIIEAEKEYFFHLSQCI